MPFFVKSRASAPIFSFRMGYNKVLPQRDNEMRSLICFLPALRSEQVEEREEKPRARTFLYVTEGCRSVTTKCEAYKSRHASPKEKNLYLFSTAKLYNSSIFSLPVIDATSITKVDFGKWKFVISESTHLNL